MIAGHCPGIREGDALTSTLCNRERGFIGQEARLYKGEPGGGLSLQGFAAAADVTEAEHTFALQGSSWDR